MSPQEVASDLIAGFSHIQPKKSWGEISFFVNPHGKLRSGSYFATLKEKDGENDNASKLHRDGIFRLNFGPGKKAFENIFGPPPSRPSKGGVIQGPWDFSQTDRLMPHPVYGWMSWMCVLNPSAATFATLKPLLDTAHARALASAMKKLEKA